MRNSLNVPSVKEVRKIRKKQDGGQIIRSILDLATLLDELRPISWLQTVEQNFEFSCRLALNVYPQVTAILSRYIIRYVENFSGPKTSPILENFKRKG